MHFSVDMNFKRAHGPH